MVKLYSFTSTGRLYLPCTTLEVVLVVSLLPVICMTSIFDLRCDETASQRNGLKYGGIYKVEQIVHKDISDVCHSTHNDVRLFVLKESHQDNTVSHFILCPSPEVPNITLAFEGTVVGLAESPLSSVSVLQTSINTVQVHAPANSTPEVITPEVQILVQHKTSQYNVGRLYIQCSKENRGGILHDLFIGESQSEKSKYHVLRKRSLLPEDKEMNMTDISMCGKSYGCFRFGHQDCGHLDCTYFVSYKIEDNIAYIEISGRTQGWLALGFSSDDKMGGDEVVVCLRKDIRMNDFRSAMFKIHLEHDQPVEMERPSKLVDYVESEGYVYCKLEVPVTFTIKGSVITFQDLTNEWYHLYAWGRVLQGGRMEKHKEMPLTSKSAVTLFFKGNVHVSSATMTYPWIPLLLATKMAFFLLARTAS